MKKCPEKDILMACADGELEGDELTRVRAHLQKCGKCAREFAALEEESVVLKAGFNELFARHRVNEKIMAEIRKSPTQPAQETGKPKWLRFLWPALGLALLLLAIVLMIPAGNRYHGSAISVSFHALNHDSTVDGTVVSPDQVFNMQACSRKSLCGNFLFSILSENPSEFVMKGTAMVSIADQAIVNFDQADVELDLVQGSGNEVTVNNSPVSLTSGSVHYRSFSPPAESIIDAGKPENASESYPAIDLATTVPLIIPESKADASGSAAVNASEPVETPVNTAGTDISVKVETVASAPIDNDQPASGVEHIFNPFVDKPLGQGQ